MNLILLPGLDGTGELFEGLLQALPQAFDVTVVRYPVDRVLSQGELVAWIEEALPASPYVLIAESFSVPLAIQVAEWSPKHLKGLVVCAGFAMSPVSGLLKELCSLLAPLAFAFPLPNFIADAFLIGPRGPAALRKALLAALADVKTTVLVDRLRLVLACDVTAELASMTVPMLYVQASEDRLVGGASYELMRLIRPEMTVAVVSGPHLILQREPERCAELILGFVEGLSAE